MAVSDCVAAEIGDVSSPSETGKKLFRESILSWSSGLAILPFFLFVMLIDGIFGDEVVVWMEGGEREEKDAEEDEDGEEEEDLGKAFAVAEMRES